jgi:hypothetical protein
MPVLVIAAHRPLARGLAVRLLDEGGEVRAVASDEVGGLRAHGIHVASADADDVGRIEAAATRVHTIVHLVGGIDGGTPERLVAEGTAVVRAAEGAGVRRLVLVTVAGASAEAADPVRRAHAAVEALAHPAAVPSVVVRSPLVDTPRLRALLRGLGADERVAERELPIVGAVDLVELVVALDRARSSAREGHLVLAAPAPMAVPFTALAAGARLGARVLPASERDALLDVLAGGWSDPEPDLPDAWRLLGVAPTPVDPSVEPAPLAGPGVGR